MEPDNYKYKYIPKPLVTLQKVNFWRPNETNGVFSNFYEAPIELKGKIWKTNEHYFQAQKFSGTEKEEFIRNLNTPSESFKVGRASDNNFPLRS